jgi:hypothetical protein
MDDMISIVKLLNCKFKVKIYIILVLPSSAVLKPAQAGLVNFKDEKGPLETFTPSPRFSTHLQRNGMVLRIMLSISKWD